MSSETDEESWHDYFILDMHFVNLVIVKSLVESEILHESMLNMYTWSLYTLADTYDDTESTSAASTPTNILNICLFSPRPTIPAKRKFKITELCFSLFIIIIVIKRIECHEYNLRIIALLP